MYPEELEEVEESEVEVALGLPLGAVLEIPPADIMLGLALALGMMSARKTLALSASLLSVAGRSFAVGQPAL